MDRLDADLWSPVLTGAPDSAMLIDHLPPYVLIVDEINRAELSRVLGELMYALEYRGVQGKIKTQYAGLVNSKGDPVRFYF